MVGKTINGNQDGNIIVGSEDDESGTTVISRESTDDNRDGFSDEGNSRLIDPGTIITGDRDRGEPTPTRRRGRPRGSKNRGTANRAYKEVSQDLSGVLFGIHLMLAKLTTIEEIELDEEESKKLSDAIVRVNSLYNDFIIPEKILAWVGLATTCGGVYGPRIATYKLRQKNEKKKPPQQVIEVMPSPSQVI